MKCRSNMLVITKIYPKQDALNSLMLLADN